jgi:hypothetical protein
MAKNRFLRQQEIIKYTFGVSLLVDFQYFLLETTWHKLLRVMTTKIRLRRQTKTNVLVLDLHHQVEV